MSTSKAEERSKKRLARKSKLAQQQDNIKGEIKKTPLALSDDKIAKLLAKNEDELIKFVVKVNKIYQEKLKRPAPFMTFVICGMQSTGKSTIMERFMSAVLNIVQEGTGTRCPLDTTCIHDDSLKEPRCDLSGEELISSGDSMSVDTVFKAITSHNKTLADEDRFSTKPLTLIYRANNVQNMRFVDTPGIITTQGTGKDNRSDIKTILRESMSRPNTKLCVLLEPKEFSTNQIIDFCDDTFPHPPREWMDGSIFLMTKFDKQLTDSRSGSKANKFFKEFLDNGIQPHLVITPTLPKEDLLPDQLLVERQELLNSATEKEDQTFQNWLLDHDRFLESNPDDELLNRKIKIRIGFESAKKAMRQVMLQDTILRLPEVLSSLRKDLGICLAELCALEEKEKLNDPAEVKILVTHALQKVQERINAYLDGDLETAIKSPQVLQDLDDELQEEEDSEWCNRVLSHHATEEGEEKWRNRLAELEYSKEIQAEKRFLGGKQVQRALLVFEIAMIESLPDPWELKEYVATGAGFLQGGLQRENWERAITSITKALMKDTCHPGVNFLIKHVGSIFRRLFTISLDDIKQGHQLSSTMKLLPPAVESHLKHEFDEMLWNLMVNSATKSHVSLEPMYSSLNPNLPTFHPDHLENGNGRDETYTLDENTKEYEVTPSKKEMYQNKMVGRIKELCASIVDGSKAKQMLREDTLKRATEKSHFLPDERTSMITDDETDLVIKRAFQYVIALTQFNNVVLQFQMNHYLYQGFKDGLDTFTRRVANDNWAELVQPDQNISDQIQELKGKIHCLKESLQEVKKMQSNI
eukprot:scaffold2751_cov154-Chaetoceros_neogracile.AAC.3